MMVKHDYTHVPNALIAVQAALNEPDAGCRLDAVAALKSVGRDMAATVIFTL